MTEDEMVAWHHRLNGHEFEQTAGDGDGQGSLAGHNHGVTKSRARLSDLSMFPTVSLSHQEVSISLLSLPDRMKTTVIEN